ncbi:MAG: hypothetical protein ACO3K7_03270 [Candidatus Marinamargulisbacteria bacterium]
MSLKYRLLQTLKSKKGNALLLATAAAISATFSVYFFVSITTMSKEAKQRVTHLYNAYTMGISVEGKINGTDLDKTYFEDKLPINELHALVTPFKNNDFVSLQTMVDEIVIVAADDPTATDRLGEKTPYDLENSGVLIKYIDDSGNVIANGAADSTKVTGVHLFVNLAGTPNAADLGGNAPYVDGEPFYYILMDDATAGTGQAVTIDTKFTDGILSAIDGGPQPATSVLLPPVADA